jgi:hypothetical protein
MRQPAAVIIVIAVLAFAAPAFAQNAQKATVVDNAPIYLQPDPASGAVPLRTAKAGTILTVVGEDGDWAQVQFKDPQWGLRTGWVRIAFLKIERPELEPMDLSVGPEDFAPQPGPERAPQVDIGGRRGNAGVPVPAPSRPSRATVGPTEPAAEQSAEWEAVRSAEKGWFDVNAGMAGAAQETRDTQATWMQTGEPAKFTTSYKAPTGADFDFGGGVMFTPVVGAGLSISGTAHRSTADISLTLPHPNYFNHYASDSGQTDGTLQYTEGAVHIQLMGNLTPGGSRFRARVFGGPTYFVIRGDALTAVRWEQAWLFTANAVDIIGTTAKEVSANAWGFHAGADLAYFFSRVVGIGGLVRFSRGSATIEDDEVMADEPLDLKVGGLQAAFGLRLRFGKR